MRNDQIKSPESAFLAQILFILVQSAWTLAICFHPLEDLIPHHWGHLNLYLQPGLHRKLRPMSLLYLDV